MGSDMAQKEEARVQLNYAGAVIDVKESSAQRFIADGATLVGSETPSESEEAKPDDVSTNTVKGAVTRADAKTKEA